MVGVIALAVADTDDEEVPLEQLPPAVLATILEAAQGGEILEIEREQVKGRWVYEAEILLNGREIEIEVAEDGTILHRGWSDDDDGDDDDGDGDDEDGDDEDDEEIDLHQVPPAARQALLEHAGDHRIVKVEREREQGVVFYEAAWMMQGRQHEAKVTADGALVQLEQVVEAGDVPDAVRHTAEELLAGADDLSYERKVIVVYEVEGTIEGCDEELLISPAGEVLDED
jgi:uncharacterized membrane protein YkoI